MSRTWRLRVWTRYRCDASRVWAYKTDPELLAREFRPYVHLTMSSADQDAVRQVLQAERERFCPRSTASDGASLADGH